MWESDIGSFPVSWASQGDEWVFHLCGRSASGKIPGRGDYRDRAVIVGPADELLPSTLRARPDPDGIRCTVAGDGDEVHQDKVQRWREAASRAATARQGLPLAGSPRT